MFSLIAGPAPISVPNINVDEFSSLLTFMYTGYLDLNITNIYSILLATHILHMPRALELCRGFLMQQRSPEEASPTKINIVKPIPSRKMTPSMQEYFGPPCYSNKPDENLLRVDVNNHPQPVSGGASCSKASPKLELEKKVSSNKNSGASKKRSETASNNNNNNNNNKDKVIVDIACCDGPVRFHRVVNKNYGLQDTENYEQHPYSDFSRSSALNKAMNENIMEKLNSSEEQSTEVFTCVYCNHTFKSQYCYQKHARRHLYPVSVDKVAQAEAKREVKLLDMNVQYYPCKTCGSKFPSYYFVHKHRKMCHAEEVADKNNKNNEIVVETGGGEESSSCSAIDVEAVQNEQEVT